MLQDTSQQHKSPENYIKIRNNFEKTKKFHHLSFRGLFVSFLIVKYFATLKDNLGSDENICFGFAKSNQMKN